MVGGCSEALLAAPASARIVVDIPHERRGFGPKARSQLTSGRGRCSCERGPGARVFCYQSRRALCIRQLQAGTGPLQLDEDLLPRLDALVPSYRCSRTRRAVIRAGLTGTAYSGPDGGLIETIPGSLVREVLEGKYGPLHFRGLIISNLQIEGTVDLSHLDWSGVLEIRSCRITGDIDLTYARVRGRLAFTRSTLHTLDLRYARIEGGVLCDGMTAQRGLRGLAASISGGLTLTRATLMAPPEDESKNRAALDLYRASLGDLYASDCQLRGGLYGIGLSVTRSVRLAGTDVWSRSSLGLKQGVDAGDGVDLASAVAGGTFYLWTDHYAAVRLHGSSLSLANASCKQLRIAPEQLVEQAVNLEGCSYSRLGPALGEDVLRMLDRRTPFPQKGYTRLAEYASDIGAEELRRRALIHQQRRVTKSYSLLSWAGTRRRLLSASVSYGYAPVRAVGWLLTCFIAASLVAFFRGDFIRPSVVGRAEPSAAESIAIATDKLLPVLSLGTQDAWQLPLTAGSNGFGSASS